MKEGRKKHVHVHVHMHSPSVHTYIVLQRCSSVLSVSRPSRHVQRHRAEHPARVGHQRLRPAQHCLHPHAAGEGGLQDGHRHCPPRQVAAAETKQGDSGARVEEED